MNTLTLLCLACAVSADSDLRIQPGSDRTRVEATATIPVPLRAGTLPGKLSQEQGETILRLCLLDPDSGAEGPAMIGSYERRANTLHFTPRFALAHDQRYRATLLLGEGRTAKAEYRVPARPATPITLVEKIYPTAAELPANQLKFYLHFSRPMRESKEIFDHFLIVDDKNKPVLDPWRRTELWSPDGKRLTLWIHPGRIKAGVNLREDFGPVLEPDRKYKLIVDAKLLDGDGQPLGRDFVKEFRSIRPERTRPRLEDWTVTPPRAGTNEPLTVKFPRPMDHALLHRMIQVLDDQGKPLTGRVEVRGEERSWQFHPEPVWKAVRCTISVDAELEDLAGNTPQQLFDVDREAPEAEVAKLTLTFTPAAK